MRDILELIQRLGVEVKDILFLLTTLLNYLIIYTSRLVSFSPGSFTTTLNNITFYYNF